MRLAYLRFCLYFGRCPVPADNITILSYTVFLCRTLKPTSISGYLNYVRLLHLDNGLINPLKDNFLLNLVKRGIQRKHGTPPKQKLPITPSILRQIAGQLDFNSTFDTTFWAACLVAFYSFLRKSSLLPKSQQDISVNTLNINDLTFESDNSSATLTIRHTKTIQFGQRILTIPLCSMPGSLLDPVFALNTMIQRLPRDVIKTNPPLFSYVDAKNNVSCLVYDSFVKRLKDCLVRAGYPADQYSGHSFRRGGCSFSFSIGIPSILIKLRGDWKSNCYERYVNVSQDMNRKVAHALALASNEE